MQDFDGIEDTILGQCAGMAADIWLRFLEFEHYPLQLGLSVDPRLSNADRISYAEFFFDLPECCVNTDLGAKVRGLFHSAVHMHADKRWLDSWAIVCKKAKLCNMHVERYFAAVRLACRHVDGAPDIEASSSGHVAGGLD